MTVAIENLTFTYRGAAEPALSKVSLEVATGDFVGVIGASGAGKTTLLSAMNGLIPHYLRGEYYGRVSVCGFDTFDDSLTDISSAVGTMFQDPDSQFVATIVEDEILYGLENFGIPKDEAENRLVEALETIGILTLRQRQIAELSGGQKQKVALAAVIAMQPQVLLLDEPTGELDPASTAQTFAMLERLNREKGMTIVVVEQKLSVLAQHARTLAILAEGSLRAFGPTEKVLLQGELLNEIGLERMGVADLSARLVDAGLADKVVTDVGSAEEQVRGILCQ